MAYPETVLHWIGGAEVAAVDGATLPIFDPHTGQEFARVARGGKADAERALAEAVRTQSSWAATSVVERALILRKTAQLIEARAEEISALVAREAGKPLKDARGETGAAVELGYFMAGEGRRYYGYTTASAMPDRNAKVIRQPVGVCALIIAANTPLPNVAWKTFPALLCGNTAVLKPSEDTPASALWFARILKEAGLPDGVFSVIHGTGAEAGAALVEDPRAALVSFTGSVGVGRHIQKTAGERLARVCLELGGKNPLVVCDDADLDFAADIAVASAFSNAGQRCASGSRILVFESVYDDFKTRFLARTQKLRLGVSDQDDLGPVINERQLGNMLAAVERAVAKDGARVLVGGARLLDPDHAGGYYMAPTILEDLNPQAELSSSELFGPITALYRVRDLAQAIELANDSPFGLTAAIHTASIHRAEVFAAQVRSGVISVNGPTHGSEPHMPFGGLRNSGNGWREPGTQALDVYSEWKSVYVRHLPGKV